MESKTLLPTGTALHENLATHHIHMWQLINNLKESRFSGYMKFEFWEYEGYLIFDSGSIVQSYEKTDNGIKSGVSALLSIEKKFHKKDGLISTYLVDSEIVPFLFAKFENSGAEKVNKLPKEKLDPFIKESIRTIDFGFIDIVFGEARAWATLYLMNGQIVASALRNSAGKEMFERGKSDLYLKILRLASTVNNEVSIKKCDPLKSYEENQIFVELSELLEISEVVLGLKNRLLFILQPLIGQEDTEELFARLWKEGCELNGINTVTYKDGHFNGLETITFSDFGQVLSEVLTQLKPLFDDKTSKYSFMGQLVNSFKIQYSEELAKLQLPNFVEYDVFHKR